MAKSIFELERRFNFDKEFSRLLDLLNQERFNCVDGYYYNQTFWTIVNKYFLEWEYRLSAINIEQYFNDLDIDFEALISCNDTKKIYVIQFIDSYIMFLVKNHKLVEETMQPIITIVQNIKIIIEKINYKRDINEGKGYITYVKRDADVDSVLSIIGNEDDLRISLLEYNDFRIEKDIQEKRTILKKLGDYLEPLRKEFNKYNKSLTDDIFFMLNKFYIRHNNEGNIKLDEDSEYIKWYDDLFKMIIQLIRTKYIVKKQDELKQFKK